MANVVRPLTRRILALAFNRVGARWARGVLVGIASVALLTLPKLAFNEVIGRPTPFLLYFGAILFAAYAGGLWPGLFTTALSATCALWFFIDGTAEQFGSRVLPILIAFGAEGVAIAIITDRFVRAQRRSLAAVANLRAARDKLNVVLAGIGEGVLLRDGSGAIIYANDLAAELTGLASRANLTKLTPQVVEQRFQLFDIRGDPFPLDRLPSHLTLLSGKPNEAVVGYRARDEEQVRWSLVRANAICGPDGNVQFVVNLFRDITESREREEALGLAKEWFQIALRSIGDAVITTDEHTSINLLNPAAEALTGWSNEHANGRPLAEVFRVFEEETRRLVVDPVAAVLREGKVIQLGNRCVLSRSDQVQVAIEATAAPIRNSLGELKGVILVFRDVSQQRARERQTAFLSRATTELNSSLDYQATLAKVAQLAVPLIADWCAVDILKDGVIERLAVAHIDPQKIQRVKEAQQRYPSDPNASTGIHQILRTGACELMPRIPEALLDAAAQDEEHKRFIHELGLRSYIGVPLMRGDKPVGVITMVMAESNRLYTDDDLAVAKSLADRASLAIEQARLFHEAETARNQAMVAVRAKDDFLAMLGHELRNPLAPIQTALELIHLKQGSDNTYEHAVIERQVKHLLRLVDDLLDVSRITRGRIALNRAPVDLREVADAAREMVWPDNSQPSHAVHIAIPSGLVVYGDRIRLTQVLTNLLINASKYTPRGGNVWLEGERTSESVVIRVRDDGIGIEPEMLHQVFEMFVQEPQSIDRSRGGLGLGLAIVRGLVAAHNGRVFAHSPGSKQGSVFAVELPAYSATVQLAAAETTDDACAAVGAITRILVVDDNADAAQSLSLLLSQMGHQVFTATCASDALKLARQEQPEVALLDIGLPHIDGYELGQRLLGVPGLSGIRLAAVTGYGQQSDRARSAAAGFHVHLVKPVSLRDINQALTALGCSAVSSQKQS